MRNIIIADTSCLILFWKIGEFDLLRKVFSNIIISDIIAKEFNKDLPEWVLKMNPKSNIEKGLLSILDPGEASAIALALENEGSLLIIDELKGRRIAKELEIRISGSLGILIIAKNHNIIPSVKSILKKIEETNFRISPKLIEHVLLKANEL